MSEPARARLLRQKGPLSFARQPSERLSVLQKHVLTSAVTIAASGLSKGPKPSDKDATFDLASNTWEWANGSNLGDEALSANSHILHPALNAGASEINQLLSRPLTIHERAAGLAIQRARQVQRGSKSLAGNNLAVAVQDRKLRVPAIETKRSLDGTDFSLHSLQCLPGRQGRSRQA